jgi:diketogulonate reductase-like aldo/keto reductase
MANVPLVSLKSGTKLPKIGYGNGTALFKSDSTTLVEGALKAGFTLIDTAEMYANSGYVGKAFETSNAKIQVIAKIGTLSKIKQVAVEERKLLGKDRLDVLLLHSPPRGINGLPTNVEAWKQMQELKEEGVADIIGVSNWLKSDIEDVIKTKPKYPIQINQIEHHPLLAGSEKQQKLLNYQREQGIASTIYGALTPLTEKPEESKGLLSVLEGIAKQEKDWSPATVLFKWASQTTKHGNNADEEGIIITTGKKTERYPGYLNLFNSRPLTDEEVKEVTEAGKQAGVHKVRMVNYFEGRDE